jgi:hypothetical protein
MGLPHFLAVAIVCGGHLIAVPLLRAATEPQPLYWHPTEAPGQQAGPGIWSAQVPMWSTSPQGTGPRVAWKPGCTAVFPGKQKAMILVEGVIEVAGIDADNVDLAGGKFQIPATGLSVATEGVVTLSRRRKVRSSFQNHPS